MKSFRYIIFIEKDGTAPRLLITEMLQIVDGAFKRLV